MKDLEKLFSLGSFSSQGSQSRSSWSNSGLKTKRGSSKQEKRKTNDRKSVPDSMHTHRKDSVSNPPEMESKEAEPADAPRDAKVPTRDVSQEIQVPKLHQPQILQETVRMHKLESRKGPRREALVPDHEVSRKREDGHEQEERRRRRRSNLTESFSNQAKNRFGSKHLEKTVSIRLVDIRNSDSDNFFIDKTLTRGSPASLHVTNAKPHRAAVTNGWLRRSSGSGGGISHTPGRPVAGQLRGWGKFRIPKRSDREEEEEHRKPLLRPLTNTPEPAYTRTRLRTGADGNGYTSDSKPGEGEVEPCLKRCHSHQLRGDSSLGRRYGSDIIRRGVLAS